MATRTPIVNLSGVAHDLPSGDTLDPAALATGTPAASNFLRGDGTWNAPDLSAYAPLNSPAFTGTPTAPTAALGTNTTQLATTAFLSATLNNHTALSGTTALTTANAGLILVSATAAYTITLPAISGTAGLCFTFIRTDNSAYAVTLARNGTTESFVGEIVTATSLTLPASTQYAVIRVVSDGSNWNVLVNNVNPNFLGTPMISGTAIATTSSTVYNASNLGGNAANTYAPLASPAFTGTPTAPTQATADSSTALATTAWVKAQGYSTAGNSDAKTSVSTTTTLTAGPQLVEVTASAAYTITLPAPGGMQGQKLIFYRADATAFAVTITHNSTETINGAASVTLPASSQYAFYVLESDGTNWVIQATNVNVTLLGTPTSVTPATADNTTKVATTAYVQSNLSSYLTTSSASSTYAPLASPSLTGVPVAPTAAVDTNTTQLATTAFVINQSYLKSSTASSTYAPLASPALTGTPTAPTAAVDTNTTQVATTAYVMNQSYLKSATASSTYAPLASPALTGTPTAPTAAVDTNTTQLATTAYVIGQAYAKLASPALTGTPTAPTAALNNNTTQIATTAFVLGQAATATPSMDGSAGVGISNTFARADHIHPTDTSRAPLASPALTGTPTAPTASAGTNTTQLATTAFVQSAVQTAVADTIVSVSTTATLSADNQIVYVSASAAYTITLPAASAMKGLWIKFIRTDNTAFAVTISRAGTDTINGGTSLTLPASAQYATLTIESDGTASWYSTDSLVSPGFSGAPTAPTAALNTNSTQLATTAFVLGQVSTTTPLMDGTAAVGSGTTFARADHIHPSDTSRAPLASPALTGTPTAPTPATADNTTKLATTAYVQSNLSSYLTASTASSTYAPLSSPTFSGTVGIGSQGAVQSFGLVTSAGSPQSARLVYGTDGSGWMLGIGKNQGGTVTTQLNIKDNGNVTIGGTTTDLGYMLGVNGTGYFASALYAPTAGAGTNSTQVATTAFVATSFAPLASPAFTGSPTAPTAGITTNSTQLATTAFVQSARNRVGSTAWAATWAPDPTTGEIFEGTATANFTLNPATAGAVDMQRMIIRVTQDASGSRLITWGTNIAFGTDITSSAALTTTASKTDIIGLMYSSAASKWYLTSLIHGF